MPEKYNCECSYSVKVSDKTLDPSKIACGCHDGIFPAIEPETLKKLGLCLNNYRDRFWALIERRCTKDESGKITDQQTYITTFENADINN